MGAPKIAEPLYTDEQAERARAAIADPGDISPSKLETIRTRLAAHDAAKAAAKPPEQVPATPPAATPAPSADQSFDSGAGPKSERGKPGDVEVALRGYGQGASGGLSDESGGLGGALYEFLHPTPRTTGRGIAAPKMSRTEALGDAYAAQRDQERAANKAAEEANSKLYHGTELAGALSQAALPVPGGAARGAGLTARLLGYAKQGAILGGENAWGHSEGDFGTQAKDTALGAAEGAALGPVAGAVGEGLAWAGGKTAKAFKSFLDEARGGPAKRELQFGGRELARKAETMAQGKEGAPLRAQARAGADDQRIEATAHDVANKATELWEHGDVVKWDEDIASKRPLVRSALEREGLDPVQVATRADSAVAQARQALDEMGQFVEKGTPDRTLLNKLQKEIGEYSMGAEPVRKTVGRGPDGKFIRGPKPTEDLYGAAADRFMRMDQVKREFQTAISKAGSQRGSAIIDELRGVAENLQGHLESPYNWGEGPSALQTIRNRAWRNRLLLEGRDAPPERMFMSDATGEAAQDPYRMKLAGDPAKIKSILQQQSTIGGEKGAQALSQWANREADLLQALTTHEGADPGLLARAKRARELATQIDAAIGQRGVEASAARDMSKIAAVKPPEPGPVRSAAEHIPIAGRALQAMRPQPLPQRISELSNAEAVLEQNPDNKLAQDIVRRAGGGPTPNSHLPRAVSGIPSIDMTRSPELRRDQERPAGDQGEPVAERASDHAVDDPRFGSMLSAAKPGRDRDVVYSELLQSNPDFAARERARAQKRNNEGSE